MRKQLFMIMIITFACIVSVNADVNMTVDMDSEGGNIDVWANPNSGSGSTTYFLDGVDYHQSIKDAANNRGSIISRVYNAFMQWRRQPTGEFAWQVTDFDSLEPAYQKLRYVLENWFVPRTEMVQVINRQQEQINQLNMEIEAIQNILGKEKICDARKQVMEERGLPSVTCGNRTVYSSGIGLEVRK